MDSVMGILGVGAILLLAGGALGLLNPRGFSLRWLLVAVTLVVLNDLMLTNGYGLLPDLLPASDWNWQGKILALITTLFVASLPQFGWCASGLTWAQGAGSLKSVLPVALLYVAFFTGLAVAFSSGPATPETLAFQLTMPGLEEELFYRGVLLLALDRAFTGRRRILGVEWGWGALLSCLLFGLAHAFGVSEGRVSFDLVTMALTAVPSLIGVWIVLRTRSVLLPVVLHNFGNAITLLL
ncbi:MAG: CPBP family intramembrane metalloprotease [Caulobacteraceae bacterium]|nr:CPBP family intramembrane metalloprotease [Caulobacteraceae bacterium]